MSTAGAGGRRPPESRTEDGVLRRIHLGTRKPGNWMQLFKFGLVGGSGYVVNLVVFALADRPARPPPHSPPRSAPSASR